jgi:adenine deaminase
MNVMNFSISGQIVDLLHRKIFQGRIEVKNGKIASIHEEPTTNLQFILPGFVDAHVHIESSLCVPSEFARLATPHGTVATVSDPHEIANVMGIKGIRYMIENGKKVPFKFYFGASSCVPATNFETAGAEITCEEIETLFRDDKLKYLSEMMNYPAVLSKDPAVMKKLEIAKKYKKPIDGHAPGLTGDDAKRYIEAGISTDHECFQLNQALHKLQNGMKVIIREGTAAKNFEALHPIIKSHPEMVMFCSDDKHCDELFISHINAICKRAIDLGHDRFDVLRCASVNPVKHYGLDVGLLQVGDPADFIICPSLDALKPSHTYINGILVAKEGETCIQSVPVQTINHFSSEKKEAKDFEVKAAGKTIRVMLLH